MATTTRSTIVAVYASPSAAQAAANELKRNGIDPDDIYIDSGGASSERPHEGGITRWFKRIFGQDRHEDEPYYESATQRGNVVLSVEASGRRRGPRNIKGVEPLAVLSLPPPGRREAIAQMFDDPQRGGR